LLISKDIFKTHNHYNFQIKIEDTVQILHNQKHTLERNAYLSHTEQFLEKIHGNNLIEDVLNKTHILDFPDSSSFGQKSRVKFVTQF
jgi:hypothetical protein